MTLVIMAAGLASRYGRTKQLEGVGPNGELLLEYSIFDARRAGFSRVVFIVRREIEAEMRAFARRLPADLALDFVIQDVTDLPSWFTAPAGRTRPWGTVHALLSARHVIDGPFGALNADDFYGAAAFNLARAACDDAEQSGTASAILFPLKATLSLHGSVVRGIGRLRDGWLVDLDEVRDIVRTEDGARGRFSAEVRPLSGDEPASMNFWVFPRPALDALSGAFDAFLRVRGHEPNAELAIPEAVSGLMRQARVRVRGLPAPGPWFGLTHQADRALVRQGLQDLVATGTYPSPLWQ